MGILELFLLAVSLAMDAFSISICGSMALHPDSRMKGA
jgi:putative Mn2+ efflux pump MntP